MRYRKNKNLWPYLHICYDCFLLYSHLLGLYRLRLLLTYWLVLWLILLLNRFDVEVGRWWPSDALHTFPKERGKKVFLMKNLCKYSRLRDLCTKNKCQIIVNNDIGLQKFTKGSLSKPQMMNWRLRLSVFLVLFLRSQKKVLVKIHNNKANLMPHKNFMGQWLIKISPCLHFNHKVMKILLWKRIGIGEDKNTPKWIQLLIFQR